MNKASVTAKIRSCAGWAVAGFIAAAAIGTAGAASAGASISRSAVPLVISAAYVPAYDCGREFHVDAAAGPGGDGSAAHPWASLQAANDSGLLQAGDCVDVAAGRYVLAQRLVLNHGGKANAPDGFVVYRSAAPHGAHLVAAPGVYGMIAIETAYVMIDGFDIDGNHAANEGEAVATNGDAGYHHIVVMNNLIHDAGGGGVQLNDSEYFWILGNTIWGNASINTYQESGISTYQAQAASPFVTTAADMALPWHIVIAGNISRDNGETYACGATPGCHTDGNGIIIDKTLNVDRKDGVAYKGRVLVAGNVVYGNGGAGIQTYLSEHVTVANNTVYDNHRDRDNIGTWRGELSCVDSSDIDWINNIADSATGDGVLGHNAPILVAGTGAHAMTGIRFSHNLSFGAPAQVFVGGTTAQDNLNGVAPQFSDLASKDFTLAATSPAREAGEAQTYLTATQPDIGAY